MIPVIAKGDTLTTEEIAAMKKQLLADFERHNVKVYPAFHCADKELLASTKENSFPFTVIGSDSLVNIKGKMVRGRAYKWGSCEGILY